MTVGQIFCVSFVSLIEFFSMPARIWDSLNFQHLRYITIAVAFAFPIFDNLELEA